MFIVYDLTVKKSNNNKSIFKLLKYYFFWKEGCIFYIYDRPNTFALVHRLIRNMELRYHFSYGIIRFVCFVCFIWNNKFCMSYMFHMELKFDY